MSRADPQRLLPRWNLRLRALGMGLVLIPVTVHWLTLNDMVYHTGVITKMSMFYHVIALFSVLCLLNLLLARIRPRWALNGAELLLIYSLQMLATALAGLDMMESLPPVMTHPFRYATEANRWAPTFHRFLPDWLTVRDPAVLKALYEGNTTLYRPEHLRVWLGPALNWCGFILLLLGVMGCLNVLVRRRWIEEERLTFPLVRLPLELGTETGSFFRNRALWAGLGIAAGIDLLGGLHHLYPWVPHVDLRAYRPRQFFPDPPWNAIGPLELGVPPFVLGIGYLLPLPMLSSCWFFFVLTRLQLVFAYIIGYGEDPKIPYLNEQTFGAYVGIALLVFWNGRTHWREIWRKAWKVPGEGNRRKGPQDLPSSPQSSGTPALSPPEALSERACVLGILLGIAGLMAFSRMAGMTWGYAATFFGLYFILSLALTRLRAELGPPAHDLPYASPGEVLSLVRGPLTMEPRDLTMNTLYSWFNRGYRGHPMPVLLEAFKLSEMAPHSRRWVLGSLLLGGAVASVAAFWSLLHVFFAYGEATAKIRGEAIGFGNTVYNQLQAWLQTPSEGDPRALVFIGLGVLVTLLLNGGRLRLAWWPLPPVGYVLQGGWMMRHIWFGLLAAWIVKSLILRYGGLRLYRQALPFFLGLILGEFLVASLWSLVGITTEIRMWSFWS